VVSDPVQTLALRARAAAIERIADTVRLVAIITETAPLQRIFHHIGQPANPPRIAPARGPPAWDDPPVAALPDWGALAQPSPEYAFDQRVQW